MTDARARISSGSARLGPWLANVFLATITLCAAAYLVPSLMGYERYVITGGSMSGTIEKGALVFERPVPVADLKVGDVITYMPPPDSGVHNLVTHRIVSRVEGADGVTSFRTKGDANAAPDPWKFSLTAPTQPVVSVAVPRVGYAFIALADRETRMLVIGVPAALVALMSLLQLARALRPQAASARGWAKPAAGGGRAPRRGDSAPA